MRMKEKGKGSRQEDASKASSDERPHLTLKEGDSGMRGSHGPMLVTCGCVTNYSKFRAHLAGPSWLRAPCEVTVSVSHACHHPRIHFHGGSFTC